MSHDLSQPPQPQLADPPSGTDPALVEEPTEGSTGLSSSTLIRLGLVILLMVSGLLLVSFTPLGDYFEKERMIGLFEELRHYWWTPVLLVGCYIFAGSTGIPSSPFLIAGGVVFGPVLGTFYNILGLLIGAMAGFYVARGLGRQAVVQMAGQKLKRAELLFAKRGFWPLVQVRFLPIPFSVVSYAAALAGLGAGRFLVASAVGLIPATVVHTYFTPKLILETLDGEKPLGLFLLYMVALALLNIFASWPQIRQSLRRRRRYRELQKIRGQRRAGSASAASPTSIGEVPREAASSSSRAPRRQ